MDIEIFQSRIFKWRRSRKINSIIQAKDKNIKNIEEFVRKNKETLDKYNKYYEQMIKANEQFIKNYPEYTE